MRYPLDTLFTLGPNQANYNPRTTDYQEAWHRVSSGLTVHESLDRAGLSELAGWGAATHLFNNWLHQNIKQGYIVAVGQYSYADAVAGIVPPDAEALAAAEKYSVLSADELLSCWSLCQDYLKELPSRDDLCLEQISERFAEHVSLLRRLELRIELLQSREQSC